MLFGFRQPDAVIDTQQTPAEAVAFCDKKPSVTENSTFLHQLKWAPKCHWEDRNVPSQNRRAKRSRILTIDIAAEIFWSQLHCSLNWIKSPQCNEGNGIAKTPLEFQGFSRILKKKKGREICIHNCFNYLSHKSVFATYLQMHILHNLYHFLWIYYIC